MDICTYACTYVCLQLKIGYVCMQVCARVHTSYVSDHNARAQAALCKVGASGHVSQTQEHCGHLDVSRSDGDPAVARLLDKQDT